MSTSSMPARIWLINGHVYSPLSRDESVPGIAYIRADIVERVAALLRRYRDETPLGHQPHMIAHEVDAALNSYREASNDKA